LGQNGVHRCASAVGVQDGDVPSLLYSENIIIKVHKNYII